MRSTDSPVIGYASRTGTKRNLDALRAAGWRLLVSASGQLRNEGFRYALDNGAWSAYSQGRPFDEPSFVRALRKMGADADWTESDRPIFPLATSRADRAVSAKPVEIPIPTS